MQRTLKEAFKTKKILENNSEFKVSSNLVHGLSLNFGEQIWYITKLRSIVILQHSILNYRILFLLKNSTVGEYLKIWSRFQLKIQPQVQLLRICPYLGRFYISTCVTFNNRQIRDVLMFVIGTCSSSIFFGCRPTDGSMKTSSRPML